MQDLYTLPAWLPEFRCSFYSSNASYTLLVLILGQLRTGRIMAYQAVTEPQPVDLNIQPNRKAMLKGSGRNGYGE